MPPPLSLPGTASRVMPRGGRWAVGGVRQPRLCRMHGFCSSPSGTGSLPGSPPLRRACRPALPERRTLPAEPALAGLFARSVCCRREAWQRSFKKWCLWGEGVWVSAVFVCSFCPEGFCRKRFDHCSYYMSCSGSESSPVFVFVSQPCLPQSGSLEGVLI